MSIKGLEDDMPLKVYYKIMEDLASAEEHWRDCRDREGHALQQLRKIGREILPYLYRARSAQPMTRLERMNFISLLESALFFLEQTRGCVKRAMIAKTALDAQRSEARRVQGL